MIAPEEFATRWVAAGGDEAFVRYEPPMLDGLTLPQEALNFLLAAGLPEGAPPFLSMDQPSHEPLPTAAHAWNLPDAFDRFRIIGFDSAGSPLCIEDGSGRVVILDHDSAFVAQSVNSSIPQFAVSLLVYQEFVSAVLAEGGEDAWIDNDIPPILREQLAEKLESNDASAVAPGSFWGEELRRLASE